MPIWFEISIYHVDYFNVILRSFTIPFLSISDAISFAERNCKKEEGYKLLQK